MKYVHGNSGEGWIVDETNKLEGRSALCSGVLGWQTELGSAFAQWTEELPRAEFAQNATAQAARFDLNEQNRWLKDQK